MQEQSGIQTNKPTQSLDSEHGVTPQSSRRKFLTKASVGIVVASLPARSVWARDGGVAQSIVASGHGSDFADGKRIALFSAGGWKTRITDQHPKKFSEIFGGNIIPNGSLTNPENATLSDVLTQRGSKYKGPEDVNFQMVAMYLNAYAYCYLKSSYPELYYPVADYGGPFSNPIAFAHHLYSKALISPEALGKELKAIIDCYHVGKTACVQTTF